MLDTADLKRDLQAVIDLTDSADTRPVETVVPGLFIIGGNVPVHQLAALYEPMIGFVVRGTKILSIGMQRIDVNGPSYFLLPMHVPVTATVHADQNGRPYRSIGLKLDFATVQELLRDIGEVRQPAASKFAACPMDRDLADALLRLLQLTRKPEEIAALAPVYKREIFYRVLAGPQGDSLRQLALRETNLSRIERTVQWIRKNLDRPMDVGDAARNTGMAVTTFHRQFKRATGLSPVQFQKQLRLIEARNLIAYEGFAVSSAAFKVGYESPSQFNREYSRFFGSSPSKHAASIRSIEAMR